MLVDPTNNFLYVVSELSNQVFAFRINTTAGTLTALSPPNQPTGTQPVSMAMHPSVNSVGQSLYSSSGQFLYTSNTTSSNITGFTLSTTSGAMSSPITVVAPAAPSGMAAH
jgi:6-phosphogluconolactonase (cycloisomerase 2 family)